MNQGKLAPDTTSDLYRFHSDVTFPSPSAAASVVAARSASGPLEWTLTSTGQSYQDLRERT